MTELVMMIPMMAVAGVVMDHGEWCRDHNCNKTFRLQERYSSSKDIHLLKIPLINQVSGLQKLDNVHVQRLP